MSLTGSCHCGNIEYVFSTQKHITSFTPRQCDCDFCKKHSAEYISDPDGEVEITVREDITPIKYVFNLKTAEFLSCPTCGTFVIATIKNQGKFFSAINIRTLDFEFQKLLGNKNEACWNGESREQRKERRFRTWTPTTFKSKNMLEHMKVNTEEGLKTFIDQFENKSLAKNKWTHEAHFVVSLWYSYHYDLDEALEKVRKFISDYNTATGVENTEHDGYHETITWLYLKSTKEFINQNPDHSKIELLDKLLKSEIIDKNYPFKFYDFKTLMSTEARLKLLEPNLAIKFTNDD